MAVRGKLFPSQAREERIFLLIRKHWFNYVIFFFLSLLAIIPVVVTFFVWINNPTIFTAASGQVVITSLSIFILSVLAVQLYGFVGYYLDVYIVTDQRIVDIKQDGYFKRQISELHLHQVQDVNARVEGVWETLFHFGDVHIQTAGERENFVFKSIPHPYLVAKQIVDLHQAHIETINRRISRKNNTKDKLLGEAEKELPFEDLEKKARMINGQTKSLDRLKIGQKTVSQQEENKKIAPKKYSPNNKSFKMINASPDEDVKENKKTSEDQGELTEGREIELK